MTWITGCGIDLPKGMLAWVDHPRLGVVWAVKDSYVDEPGTDDHDSQAVEVFFWCAFAAGEAFELEEVTRYWVIERPPVETPRAD